MENKNKSWIWYVLYIVFLIVSLPFAICFDVMKRSK